MYRLLPIGRPVATSMGHERQLRARVAVPDRGLGPVAEVRLGLRPGDRPAPDRRVERDLGEAGHVVEAERLEPDDPALERDRLDRSGSAIGDLRQAGIGTGR